jgi:hypothetical protein
MLNETVKAPSFFTTSMVAKKAKEVQSNPKNNNHKKSLTDITNNEVFNVPLKTITSERNTSAVNSS